MIGVIVYVTFTENFGTYFLLELRVVEHVVRSFMRQVNSLTIWMFECNVQYFFDVIKVAV